MVAHTDAALDNDVDRAPHARAACSLVDQATARLLDVGRDRVRP